MKVGRLQRAVCSALTLTSSAGSAALLDRFDGFLPSLATAVDNPVVLPLGKFLCGPALWNGTSLSTVQSCV